MKGMVFNLLEDFIVEVASYDQFEEIYAATSLVTKEPFVGPGIYPDEDFFALVARSSAALGLEPAQAVEAFGAFAFAKLVGAHPEFARAFSDAKSFIMAVNDIIHVEVRKLYPGVKLPEFTYDETASGSLIITYHSERQLCFFMLGLMKGCGDFYGQTIGIKHSKCVFEGGDHCVFVLTFEVPQ